MPSRTPRWRRYTIRAVLCLLLGAVTTVGVAWAAAATRPERKVVSAYWLVHPHDVQEDPMGDPHNITIVVQSSHLRTTRVVWAVSFREVLTNTPLSAGATIMDNLERMPLTTEWQAHPATRRMLAGGWGRLPAQGGATSSLAFGWPTRALWQCSERKPGFPPARAWDGSLRVNERWRLPAYMIFPGFLFDTLFYAAPWWLILVTPGALKRWRRRRRGRCMRCGYDLTGLKADDGGTLSCPECGTADGTPERGLAPQSARKTDAS